MHHRLNLKHQRKNETKDNIGRLGKETFEFNDSEDIKDIQVEFVEGSSAVTKKKSVDEKYEHERN